MSFRSDPAAFDALRQAVTPEELRHLARTYPGAGDLFGQLADALEAEDAQEAVDAVVTGAFGEDPDPRMMVAWLQGLSRTFGAAAGIAAQVAQDAAGDAAALARDQQVFALAADAEDDPTLRAAFEALADPSATQAVGGLFADLARAAGRVDEVITAAGAGRHDPGALAALERDLRDLESRARHVDPTPRLLDAFRALRSGLQHRDDPRSAQVALMEAALRRDAGSDARDSFEDALALAERFGVLQVAQEAASTLQIDAIRAGDMARVAAIARRVVAVADRDGEFRARVLARLDEALAVARTGAPTSAYDLADQAHDLAKEFGIPELVARAALARIQIVEQTGHLARAASAYRDLADKLLQTEDDGTWAVAGRAWMGLARCVPHGPDRLAAWQRAQRLGAELGDRLLYVHGSLGIIEENLEADDRFAVVAGLVQFRAASMHMGNADDAGPFDRAAAGIRESWGPEAFDRELLAFRAKLRSS